MTKRKLKHKENDIFLEDMDLDEEGYPEDPETEHEYGDGYAKEYREDFDSGYGGHNIRHDRRRDHHDGYGPESGRDRTKKTGHKKKKKRRKWPFVILAIVLILAGVLLFNNFRTGRNWTIAVFGVDSRSTELENGTRSDVIMIVNIDRLTGDVKLCSVFRDTYLKIDEEGTYKKINAAYERGGHEQAIAALEENLDIKIDDYATFSWGTVAKAINLMGGIDIEITDAEFRYINAFITETVEATGIGSTQLQSAGWNHLDGVQAVAYGRLRLMDTDFQRTARQRKVLSLMLDKVKIAEKAALINMATTLIGEVSTSVGIDDIMPVIATAARFNIPEDGSSGFPFSRQTEDIGKQNYVIPTTLESNVVMLHQFLFGDEDYTAPQSVKDISARIAADSGLGEAGEAAPVPQVGGSSGGGSNAPAETEAQTAAETEAPETETTMEAESETDESLDESESSENDAEDEAESSETESAEHDGTGDDGGEDLDIEDEENDRAPAGTGPDGSEDNRDEGGKDGENGGGPGNPGSSGNGSVHAPETPGVIDRPQAPSEGEGPGSSQSTGGPGSSETGGSSAPSENPAPSPAVPNKDTPINGDGSMGPGAGL